MTPQDLRHLAPPEPMEIILDAAEQMRPGDSRAWVLPHHPTPLLPMLEKPACCIALNCRGRRRRADSESAMSQAWLDYQQAPPLWSLLAHMLAAPGWLLALAACWRRCRTARPRVSSPRCWR